MTKYHGNFADFCKLFISGSGKNILCNKWFFLLALVLAYKVNKKGE